MSSKESVPFIYKPDPVTVWLKTISKMYLNFSLQNHQFPSVLSKEKSKIKTPFRIKKQTNEIFEIP